jgi:cell division ATPase FtsA
LCIEALSSASAAGKGTQSLCYALADQLMKDMKEPVERQSKKGARLMTALQKSLKELSMLPDTKLAIECFYSDEGDLVKDLTRAQLEEIARPQFEQIVELVKKVIADAGVAIEDVHSIELVGGGIRIPKVQQVLSDLFPQAEPEEEEAPGGLSKRLRFGLDGASAMATGTALYAAGKRALVSKWTLADQKSSLPDEKGLTECKELEAWMTKTNGEEVMRLAKCNEFESYIYEVRSWLSGPDRALLKPETTEPILDKAALWFEDAQYDEAITLAMFTEHLDELKKGLEENATEFYAKKQKEKEDKEKFLDEEAEKERQRRHDLGMDADKDDRKMAKSERLKMAGKNKEEGNTVFKAGNLEDAAARYQRSLQHLKKFMMLDFSPDEKAEADAITLSVQLNLAQVYLKLAAQTEKDKGKEKAEEVYKKAKAAAEEALSIDAENVKAKFRKASACEKLGDLDGATKEVKSALKTDPENTDLVKLKDRLDKLHAQQKDKAKKMYGKMFG